MALNVAGPGTTATQRSTVDVRPDSQAPFGLRVATPTDRARGIAKRSRSHTSQPKFWVYGRQRHGCLRCGGPVKVEPLGLEASQTRNVYWCPACQQS